jgi:phosphate transport system substrate-binding protein
MMVLSFAAALLAAQPVLDSDVPDYRPATSLKGSLSIGPADGYEKLLSLWAQRLKSYHPDLSGPEFLRTGPQQTPQAMGAGNAQCGMHSRPWTGREVESFRESTGGAPFELVVASDAVAIIVHPDNPLRALKLEEIDAVFSSTLNRGSRAFQTWGEFKLGAAWTGKAIHAYGLAADATPASHTRDVFLKLGLQKGKLREEVKELPSAAAVLQAVAEDPLAMGFLPTSAGSKGVHVVPILSADSKPIDPSWSNLQTDAYPLSWQIRFSYRWDRGTPLDPILHDFVAFILSREGQTIAAEEGYAPISGPLARKQTKVLK